MHIENTKKIISLSLVLFLALIIFVFFKKYSGICSYVQKNHLTNQEGMQIPTKYSSLRDTISGILLIFILIYYSVINYVITRKFFDIDEKISDYLKFNFRNVLVTIGIILLLSILPWIILYTPVQLTGGGCGYSSFPFPYHFYRSTGSLFIHSENYPVYIGYVFNAFYWIGIYILVSNKYYKDRIKK